MIDQLKFKKPFYINEYLVDPESYEVNIGEEKRRLTARTFNILKCLILNQKEYVEYADLEKEVWREQVSENAIQQQLNILRKLLDDDAYNPKIIKTIPKRGYKFVGKISHPNQKNTKKTLNIFLKTCSLLAILCAAYIGFTSFNTFKTGKQITPQQILLSSTSLVDYPTIIVALNTPKKIDHDTFSGISTLLNLIVEHHIDLNREVHILGVPEGEEYGAIYNDVVSNLSTNSSLKYFVESSIQYTPDNKALMELTIRDALTGSLIRHHESQLMDLQNILSSGLYEYELDVIRILSETGLVPSEQQRFLLPSKGSNEPTLAAALSLAEARHSSVADINSTIELLVDALSQNPKNLVAYSLLWETVSLALLEYQQMDLDYALTTIKSQFDNAVTLYPDYYRNYHVISSYYNWMQDKKLGATMQKEALKRKPYNGSLLLALIWHLHHFNIPSQNVDEINFSINPFARNSLYRHRNTLMLSGKLSEAAKLLNKFSYAPSNAYDWRLRAQADTSLRTLQEFSSWYRTYYATQETPEDSQHNAFAANPEASPTRYMGYLLLNANQPNLARFWANNTKEGKKVFLDERLIALLADLWQGTWDVNRWTLISKIAEERKSVQNTFDKMSMFYFYYIAGLYQNSMNYLLEIYPEFSSNEFVITENNFRFAVYYFELKKQTGDYSAARKISKTIKTYLNKRPYFAERNVSIGISDVEFYSLIGERDKAIETLKNAVENQNWLPNAIWLWPPLNQNPFLVGLNTHPEFLALQAHIDKKLRFVCFESTCKP